MTAVLLAPGRHVALYVDQEGYNLTSADLDPLVRRFDEVIHPTALAVYGRTSDIDGNGRVVVC